jgi:hypothetical protein
MIYISGWGENQDDSGNKLAGGNRWGHREILLGSGEDRTRGQIAKRVQFHPKMEKMNGSGWGAAHDRGRPGWGNPKGLECFKQ